MQNQDELFDVVDAQDQVIGQATRGVVHREGLLHRAVHLLVRNPHGELFLQQRSLSKDKHPGVWDSSASGHVDAGEDYDTAARRELREELGLQDAPIPQRLRYLEACGETGQEFVWIYHLDHAGPFALHPGEIRGGGWFTDATIDAWTALRAEDFAPAFVYLWKHLRAGSQHTA